jgi:hypothetical protein
VDRSGCFLFLRAVMIFTDRSDHGQHPAISVRSTLCFVLFLVVFEFRIQEPG